MHAKTRLAEAHVPTSLCAKQWSNVFLFFLVLERAGGGCTCEHESMQARKKT